MRPVVLRCTFPECCGNSLPLGLYYRLAVGSKGAKMATFSVGTVGSGVTTIYGQPGRVILYNAPPGSTWVSSNTVLVGGWMSITISPFRPENPTKKAWRELFNKIDEMDEKKAMQKGG